MKYPFVVAMLALSAVCFHCSQVEPLNGSDEVVGSFGIPAPGSAPHHPVSAAAGGGVSASGLAREINLRVDMVARGTHGRKVVRPMKPRYITIHSTQNYSADRDD